MLSLLSKKLKVLKFSELHKVAVKCHGGQGDLSTWLSAVLNLSPSLKIFISLVQENGEPKPGGSNDKDICHLPKENRLETTVPTLSLR